MIEERLVVEGMACDACVRHVTSALEGLAGVSSASVDLDSATATVVYDPEIVNVPAMVAAIDEEGYAAQLVC